MSYKPNFSDAPEWKGFTLNRKQPSAKGGQRICSDKNILKTAYFTVLYPGFMVK